MINKQTLYSSYKSASLPLAIILLFILLVGCGGSSENKPNAEQTNTTITTEDTNNLSFKLNISANEVGSAIYIDGNYSGAVTPAEVTVNTSGEHTIGIGLKSSRRYLKRTINVSDSAETLTLVLDDNDMQQAKIWRTLFIGVNKVAKSNQSCVSEYSTLELDQAFEFFKWSFSEKVTDYSYNTSQWKFDRRDIVDETILLSDENLITPAIIDNYIEDIKPGDYDLIVTFFRGGAGNNQACFIDDFVGIAWFDVTELNANASYYTIRYYDDVAGKIAESKQSDPGMFIHEWLHTTAEMFYPSKGATVPISDGQVVHAAGAFNYNYPWMLWYQDLISGQVKRGESYIGIGPEALLACSVRESALEQC